MLPNSWQLREQIHLQRVQIVRLIKLSYFVPPILAIVWPSSVLMLIFVVSPADAQWAAIDLDPPHGQATPSVPAGGAENHVVGTALVIGWSSNQNHAFIWPWNAPRVDLNPAGATSSEAVGTTDTKQFGNATFGSAVHAGLWNGTAASWVDLNPAGATNSNVIGFVDAQQVGTAKIGTATHASRWNGTAASWVDLHPSGASASVAYATTGSRQVGSATFGGSIHAGLWNGTAATWVDLHPAGATESVAKFIDPNLPGQQVGYAKFGSNIHAGLWNGTAASWTDLNPAGATSSQVNGISSGATAQQVGQAIIGGAVHAGFWNGFAGSWVDLNPAGATESVALASFGTRQVGYARVSGITGPGVWHGNAGSWEPLPLPESTDKGGGWAYGPAECSSIWTDGIRLYASGYITGWHYVGSVQFRCAVLWWQPLCTLSGDINGDGHRDGADVQGFLNCLLGVGGSCSCADLDGNGTFNSADGQAFVIAVLGW